LAVSKTHSITQEWGIRDRQWVPIVTIDGGPERIKGNWVPQEGSQRIFLECPIFETLYGGTRGPGKTDALIMDFASEVGKGFGREWRGILFRRTYPELEDLINKTLNWFPRFFPKAKYNASSHTWRFPDGEELLLRHFLRQSDYWSYHGHAYPWIGWEELTTWSNSTCYLSMFSCIRSTNPNVPSRLRATTNPYGPGHNWVKRRWKLPHGSGIHGPVIRDMDDKGNRLPDRVYVHGTIHENKVLLHSDPKYINRIRASASNPAMIEAWLSGSWDITSGGMFDDVWSASHHIIPPFNPTLIPREWRIDRAYDHGSSSPFSVGWYAESNGEPFRSPTNQQLIGNIKGDIIRFGEWYGWNGRDNEGLKMDAYRIGQGIRERESDWGISQRVKTGPADTQIFDNQNEKGSIAHDLARAGVNWNPADKGPGSRKQGWQTIRTMLRDVIPVNGVRERPGFFVTSNCEQFIRTVPSLTRDDKDLDEINKTSEDHVADEVRYRLRRKPNSILTGSI
jgi:hypothetical protein